MPTLEDAIKYCKDARDILGTAGYFRTRDTEESKAAKKALDAVTRKLAAFKKTKIGKAYIDFEDEFIALAEISKDSNDKSRALTLTAQLVHLGNRIDFAIVKNGGTAVGNVVDLTTSLSTLTTTVEKIYQDELKAANDRKRELTPLNKVHTDLYGGPFTFDAAISAPITNAEYVATVIESASPEERLKAFTNAIGWLAGVKKAHSEGLKLHTDYEAYKTQMDKAEKYRVELFLLSTVKDDYSVTFTVAMDAAREDASNKSPYDFKAAVTRLNTVIPTYKTLKQGALAAEGKEKLAAAKKPIYDDKVRRIENDIRELKALPGTQSAVTTLEDKLKAGNEVAKTGDYELARQSLKGSNKAHEAGKTAADNFQKTMDSGYKTALEKARKKLLEVEELVGRSQFKEIAEQQQAIDKSVMRLSEDRIKNLNAETGKISRIFGELVTLANTEAQKRAACESVKNDATTKIEEFQERYLIANYDDVLPKFRQAESEFAMDNYVEAKGLYEGVTWRLGEILGAGGDNLGYETWKTNLTDFETNLKKLDKVRDSTCKYLGHLKYTGSEGSESLLQLEEKATTLLENLELTRDYLAANRIANDVTQAMKDIDIEEILKQYDDTKAKREDLLKQTNDKIALANGKITDLGNVKGHVEEFKIELKKLQEEWMNILERSDDLKTEDKLNSKYLEFVNKLTPAIITPIEEMLSALAMNEKNKADSNEPALTTKEQAYLDKLTASQKAADISEEAKKFEQKLSEISATITFMKKDASAYASLAPKVDVDSKSAELDAIKALLATELAKDTDQKFDTLNKEVPALETDLASVIAALDTKRGSQSTAAINKIKACSDSLEQLKHSNPKFETYFKEFTNRVEDLKAMADSKILTTVDQCCDAADALEKTLDELSKSKSFSNINDDLKLIEKGFEELAEKNTLPVRLAGLKMRFEKRIEPDLYEEGPVDGKSKVGAFLKEVEAAVVDADAATKSKGKITNLVDECTDELLTMTDAPNLKASYQGMITSASTPAEGDEESARQRLEIIEMAIKRLKKMSAEDRLKEEQSKVREKNTEELRRIEFEAELKVFEAKQFKEAGILMESTKPNENSNLYNQISELRDEADKMFKEKNVDGAFQKLDAARTAAQRFLNNPFSIQVNAKNNLKALGENWLKTISTFVKSMNELKAVVEASMTTENEGKDPQKFNADSFTAMKEPLTEAARSFEATKFRDFIDKISKADDPAKIREYRRLKEDALRFVRAYQTIVTKDPVLLSAASNPFKVEVSLSSVKDALRVLEINLRSA